MLDPAPLMTNPVQAGRNDALLDAAADCFRTRGYAATSIDAVARQLGATKGRVYHYFPSKMDLFNAVRDRAMDLVFDGIDAGYHADRPAEERLVLMARGHARAMIRHHAYMQVLLDGLQMHRFGALTPEQRAETLRHIERRHAYEACFREVVQEAASAGALRIGAPFSITIQTFLSALNGPVAWYGHRAGDTDQTCDALVREIVRFALLGLGLDLTAPRWAALVADTRTETATEDATP